MPSPDRASRPRRSESDPEASLERVLAWARAQDYAGFSKFDVFNSALMRRLSLGARLPRLALTAAWSRLPIDLRPLVGTERSRNPKGIALFALAYLRRHRRTQGAADLAEAEHLLAWLEQNRSPGFERACWGYDHDWQSLHFFAPKFSPNIVVTGNVAYAFLEAFEVTGKRSYLDTARSAVEFMRRDLAAPVDTAEMRSIGYVPGNAWGVLNINGLAAALFLWAWQHTGEATLRDEGTRLMRFLIDKQTPYGAWHYAWPSQTSNVRHDNYHTGNVLDWVLDYSRRSGDDQFVGNYGRGLAFYRDNLFLANGAPKWMSDRIYPFDVHGAAQGTVTFAKATLEFDSTYLPDARRVATWAIENLQAPEGYFRYQIGRFWTKRYTLMRWCNAWMAFALASLLLAEERTPAERDETCAASPA